MVVPYPGDPASGSQRALRGRKDLFRAEGGGNRALYLLTGPRDAAQHRMLRTDKNGAAEPVRGWRSSRDVLVGALCVCCSPLRHRVACSRHRTWGRWGRDTAEPDIAADSAAGGRGMNGPAVCTAETTHPGFAGDCLISGGFDLRAQRLDRPTQCGIDRLPWRTSSSRVSTVTG